VVVEALVIHIHRVPVPADYPAHIVQQPTEFDAYAPTPFVPAFLADLKGTAPLADWENQFDGITVDHGEKRGIGQKQVTPISMGFEQALQASAFGQG